MLKDSLSQFVTMGLEPPSPKPSPPPLRLEEEAVEQLAVRMSALTGLQLPQSYINSCSILQREQRPADGSACDVATIRCRDSGDVSAEDRRSYLSGILHSDPALFLGRTSYKPKYTLCAM